MRSFHRWTSMPRSSRKPSLSSGSVSLYTYRMRRIHRIESQPTTQILGRAKIHWRITSNARTVVANRMERRITL
ncbi:hypothetical protein PUNSTDRAFT_146888 [Punctularia strigosozonata HHB-11173 SS5]|uniref:Uncharacterized protein n=1 Tax=Punctularia strigosozonata (strain HHB-11173) TaxID=741275 RepID=R7S1I3_PUNST|nr:uncharacterized protein PUNSTDRAFT_146888 [Punctularia strigosozonata HHB-11173 SS5]EIN03709.1 hypothetical protein PUNSTDRAFT_146888 [Punctularia strigosozonata HHB-11173 SS5]